METSEKVNSLKHGSNQTSAVTALACWIVGCLAGEGLIEVNRNRDQTGDDLFEAVWLVSDCLTAYDIEVKDLHPVPKSWPPGGTT